MKKQSKKRKSLALTRYGIVVVLLLLVMITAIVVAAGKVIFTDERDIWIGVGEKSTIIKDRIILPTRGNIYTHDGKLLATSEPKYEIYIDFWADGIKEDTLMKYVGDLAIELSKKFEDRSAAQYKKVILDGWNMRKREQSLIEEYKREGVNKRVPLRSRYVRIIRKDISYIDLKEIRTFPFLNQRSNRSGMIAQEKNSRKKPFGNLANRTVGSVYGDLSKGGASGLELKYDSLLRGVQGVKSRQKVHGRWIDVEEVAAQDGYDIITTIDAEIQDITERALRSKLEETFAESGTAIVLDVKTGEVKAISNLDRLSGGGYAEGNPNAFSYMSEPGSTFKAVTVMVALDDGIITPTDSFHVGNGIYTYKGKQVYDHYWRQGRDRGYLTVQEGMEVSSNIVMSKIVLEGYEDNPKKFIDGIDKIGLRKSLTWDVPLQGIEGTSNIRYPDDKHNYWSKTTLPWMSFGYESQLPPIYLAMFYNAIANEGKMIKPFITKSLIKEGRVVETFNGEVINKNICKKQTLDQIKTMLEGVVENGTAKVVQSEYFSIAGKTGTALIASGGGYNSGYYVSFVGYFPADNPRYTCFVGLRRPQGVPSGGGQSGMVFKNIAEQIFVRETQLAVHEAKVDSTLAFEPVLKNGNLTAAKKVLSKLSYQTDYKESTSEWVSVLRDSLNYVVRDLNIDSGSIPNVIGMGAKDAVYLLNQQGLNVRISGSGKVVSQSLARGSRAVKGASISLVLK